MQKKYLLCDITYSPFNGYLQKEEQTKNVNLMQPDGKLLPHLSSVLFVYTLFVFDIFTAKTAEMKQRKRNDGANIRYLALPTPSLSSAPML